MNRTERALRVVRAAPWHALLAAVPVVLVNVVAFSGQLAFLREHLPWLPVGQVLMAVTLESIAVYLAWQAHLAQLANDSALRLRLAAYSFALLIAAMNYSHYAGPGWRPTFAAVAVALCSAASPWLWGIHTRRASRDALMTAGLVEPHALRLGATRWTWHPLKSAKVMHYATWEGLADPTGAIGAVYPEDVAGENVLAGAHHTHPAGLAGSPATPPGSVPSSSFEAAKVSMADTARAGNPWSRNQLQARFGLTRAEATEVWAPYQIPKEAGPFIAKGGDGHGEGRQDGDADRQGPGREAYEDPGRGRGRRQGRQGQVGDPPAGVPQVAPAPLAGDGWPLPTLGTAAAGTSPNGRAHG